ncbi:MAG: tetratricopeptide repeat protein [Hyphomicrobiales bacterium]
MVSHRVWARRWAPVRAVATAGAVAALLATGLSGCTTALTDPMTTGSTSAAAKDQPQEPSIRRMATAKQAWEADQNNVKKGLAYAGELMALDQDQQALQVVTQIASNNPDNMELAAYYGKILIQSGELAEGEKQLQKVIASGKADWKVYSALGSALDQQGRYDDARKAYQQALSERPNEISVLNNLGMSYALSGDLKQAEQVLQKASDLPGGAANPRLRQNLALVVGLQGRYDEAQQIASRDLPPEQAQANVEYLRKMMSQSNPWAQISGTGSQQQPPQQQAAAQ